MAAHYHQAEPTTSPRALRSIARLSASSASNSNRRESTLAGSRTFQKPAVWISSEAISNCASSFECHCRLTQLTSAMPNTAPRQDLMTSVLMMRAGRRVSSPKSVQVMHRPHERPGNRQARTKSFRSSNPRSCPAALTTGILRPSCRANELMIALTEASSPTLMTGDDIISPTELSLQRRLTVF